MTDPVAVHPLALLSIADHLESHPDGVGALLGTAKAVEAAVPLQVVEGRVSRTGLSQDAAMHAAVHPARRLIGWYAASWSPEIHSAAFPGTGLFMTASAAHRVVDPLGIEEAAVRIQVDEAEQVVLAAAMLEKGPVEKLELAARALHSLQDKVDVLARFVEATQQNTVQDQEILHRIQRLWTQLPLFQDPVAKDTDSSLTAPFLASSLCALRHMAVHVAADPRSVGAKSRAANDTV